MVQLRRRKPVEDEVSCVLEAVSLGSYTRLQIMASTHKIALMPLYFRDYNSRRQYKG